MNFGCGEFYESVEVLQRDLGEWLRYRNESGIPGLHENRKKHRREDKGVPTIGVAGRLRVQLVILICKQVMKTETTAGRIKRLREG